MDRVDITILGGGPVGLFAAFYAGMRGMSTRIIDSLTELGGQLVALYPEKYVYDMPGFPKALAKDLAREMIAQGLQFEPDVRLGVTATGLEPNAEGYDVILSDGARAPTRTLIVAAGAGAFSPTKLGVEDEETFVGKGLTYGVRDPQSLTGKRVAIVGGGDSAFDWALALEPIAERVWLIHRRDQFRAHEHTVRQVEATSVEFKLWNVVDTLHGGDALTGVRLKHTQSGAFEDLDCDVVLVNVGFKSSLGPIKDWGMTIEKNQIAVNPTSYETSLSRVFAVGDVATYPGKLKLIATGVGEAVTAVCFAKQALEPDAKLFPGHSSDRDE